MTNTSQLSSINDIVAKINQIAVDGSTYYLHLQNSTLDQYYDEIIQSVVYDITVMPLYRVSLGLDLENDKEEIQSAFQIIISEIATLFNKSNDIVEADLVHAMTTFPVVDVQNATWLKQQGKLH